MLQEALDCAVRESDSYLRAVKFNSGTSHLTTQKRNRRHSAFQPRPPGTFADHSAGPEEYRASLVEPSYAVLLISVTGTSSMSQPARPRATRLSQSWLMQTIPIELLLHLQIWKPQNWQ